LICGTSTEAIPAGGCGLDAECGVLEDQAGFGFDAEAFGSEKEAIGRRFALYVVFGADEDVEFVEDAERRERTDHGITAAAGDDCEGNATVLREHMLKDWRDGFELGKQFVIEGFFAGGERFDGHLESVHLIQVGDDFADWLSAPRIEKFLVVVAVPFGERFFPCDVMEGHGVGDGAVTVEEISAENSSGQFELHASDGTPCEAGLKES
jgi:hypothetical protein